MLKEFAAAVMMFTRLPLWRITSVDKKYFSNAILYWPLIGYVTGCTTAFVFWGAAEIMPVLPACIIAILARLLLTGALHEDGLADFLDGFGGGAGKENILMIMKDSHIGCYGTIGLIVYFMLYFCLLLNFDGANAFAIILSADCFSKLAAATMINSLPYVRKEEESKAALLYNKLRPGELMIVAAISLLPLCFISDRLMLLSTLPAILAAFLLRQYLKRKIGGYTGDCCGASVLIIELVFYLGATILFCIG